MSFTLNGQTLEVTLNVTIPSDLNLIESNPRSGEYQIKGLRLDTDMKTIMVTHDDTAEA